MTFRRLAPLLALALGLAGLLGAALALAAANPADLTHRSIVPGITRAELAPTPTPAPPPEPYIGPVRSLYLESARLYGNDPIEIGASHYLGAREVLDDPTAPSSIVHYALPYLAEAPGFGGGHSIFAAHVDYMNYGLGPFAYLTEARPGDTLTITMANGAAYAYEVISVKIVSLTTLNMDDVVFPPLDSKTERVTLISCGGTFIPAAVGGEYTSRVILVAERHLP